MRSNLLTLAATAASLLATVRAEDWWYAIYNENFMAFLDYSDSTVTVSVKPSVDAISASGDKGMRWKFLSGTMKDSDIANQAHKNHIVGYDSADNEFHADYKTSNTGSAVKAHFINDTHLTLCFDSNSIDESASNKSLNVLLFTTDQYINDSFFEKSRKNLLSGSGNRSKKHNTECHDGVALDICIEIFECISPVIHIDLHG